MRQRDYLIQTLSVNLEKYTATPSATATAKPNVQPGPVTCQSAPAPILASRAARLLRPLKTPRAAPVSARSAGLLSQTLERF